MIYLIIGLVVGFFLGQRFSDVSIKDIYLKIKEKIFSDKK